MKMCSVTLDLLHTCEFCDKDFVSMERLMVLIEKQIVWTQAMMPIFFSPPRPQEHMSVCRSPSNGTAAPGKRRLERACVQGSTVAQPPTVKAVSFSTTHPFLILVSFH